jgi:hypothetical protein
MVIIMDPWTGAAAVAAFATFLIHTVLGGREIATPLLAAGDLARIPKFTSYYCWHMVTIVLFAMAAGLAWGGWTGDRAMIIAVFALAVAFCALSIAMVRAFRVSPWHMPQWSLFLVIAILSGVGAF